MAGIAQLFDALPLSASVRQNALAVYTLIAEAEGAVHGRPAGEVHFHEVGALDAVADVTAVCMLMDELAPQTVAASTVQVGGGQVRCAHGLLPVPAPATARLLLGLPSCGGAAAGELCTPPGAALLRHFVRSFGPQPAMRVEKIGYGCGKKDFDRPNCLRASLGETSDGRDQVSELCCNLDDCTPEAVGFAMERLFAAGALDVYTVPVGMKKNRPGILLCCVCRAGDRETMVRLLFRHTTTLGVRERLCDRFVLDRESRTAATAYGPVRVKRSHGWGADREKPEYDDLAAIAAQNGMSLREAAAELTLDAKA